jgi:hypothetical protein
MTAADASLDQKSSGLTYDASSNTIRYRNGPRLDLTLPETSPTMQPFCRCPPAHTSERIEAAFLSVENTGAINDSFLLLIKKLDHDVVKSAMAWVSSKAVKILNKQAIEKMYLQQCVYSPFAALFLAATTFYSSNRDSRYAADQQVDSSLSVLGPNRNDHQLSPKSITIKPYSALTLGDRRDALGIMEIKASCKVDKDQCVLVTAATARVLYQLLESNSYGKVVLPFVIANGTYFGLFVTCLDEDGAPTVSYIPLLEPGQPIGPMYSCEESPDPVRSKMFVALAVILDDLCSLLDDEGMRTQYAQTFRVRFEGENIFSGNTKSKR